MRHLRAFGAWLSREFERREVICIGGLVLLGYGGETLYPGAGYAVAGLVMVWLAVFGVH